MLIETARRISSAIRNSDVVDSMGGDEVMVVSYTNRDDARTLAQRVLDAVGGTDFEVGANRMRRSCSVGWRCFPGSSAPQPRRRMRKFSGWRMRRCTKLSRQAGTAPLACFQ